MEKCKSCGFTHNDYAVYVLENGKERFVDYICKQCVNHAVLGADAIVRRCSDNAIDNRKEA